MTTPLTRCVGCPHQIGKLVGSKGPIDSPIVIVGESPGVLEIREGYPFVGPSGTILDAALSQHQETAKDSPLEPYITNAHICFPGATKFKDPDKVLNATRLCHGRLEQEIAAHPRKVILSLGNNALWSLTGNYNTKITQVRGQVFKFRVPHTLQEVPIVAAVHPSFLMHGGGSLRQFMNDVDYAISLCKGDNYRKFIIPEYRVLNSIDELEQLASKLKELPENTVVAADSETGGWDGFDYLRDHILCSGFCWDPHVVWVIPGDLTPSTSDLFDNNCRFAWHNGKFDAKFFRAGGCSAVRVDDDTMLLSYALEESGGQHNLEQVGSDIIGCPDWKFMIQPYLQKARDEENFSPKLTENQKGKMVYATVTYDCIPRPVLYDYMSRDISTTLQVFPILRRQVKSDAKLELLYTKTLMPASNYLIQVEETGMELDLDQVKLNSVRLQAEITKYEGEINQISIAAGHTQINPNSWQQLGVLMFDVLKIKHKNRETNVKALDKLPDHPVIRALKKYRKVQKAHSTYVKSAPGWVNTDGRVHTTYKIHGTTTGRLASEDPNLLNIPRDPLLRGQFKAKEKHLYLEVDANQAELRVLAELSGDEVLIKIYTTKGMSLHDEVIVFIWGKHSEYSEAELQKQIAKFNVQNFPEKLYDEQKMRAKNVNFGIVYGITAFGLSEQTDFPSRECQEWLDAWAKRFPQAWNFILRCREAPQKNQTLCTPFGRKRRFGVVSPERIVYIQNQAANFPEQSIASDIVLHTGFKMEPIARRLGVRICNTIYDSILYEPPNDESLIRDLAAQTIETLADTAKEWGLKKVPFLGEAKAGERWGNLKSLDKFFKRERELAA